MRLFAVAIVVSLSSNLAHAENGWSCSEPKGTQRYERMGGFLYKDGDPLTEAVKRANRADGLPEHTGLSRWTVTLDEETGLVAIASVVDDHSEDRGVFISVITIDKWTRRYRRIDDLLTLSEPYRYVVDGSCDKY